MITGVDMTPRFFAATLLLALTSPVLAQAAAPGANPIIRDKFTADPAPLVVGDTLYLYTGHDVAQRDEMFNMQEWLVYSTKDMKHWTDHGPIMNVKGFKWAKADAWASQAIRKNGKFWFYAAVEHDDTNPGKAQVAPRRKPSRIAAARGPVNLARFPARSSRLR